NNTNYQWAMDAFFDVDGTVSWVTGGVAGGGNYVVPIFTWFDVQIIVDIDNDQASFYIDNNLLQTWQWSLNNANGSQGIIDFVAVNFYGTNTAGGDGYYFIDNVSVDHISVSECNIAIGCPSGCTDAAACNYLASAQCDDGSCYYTDYNSQITIPNGNFESWNSSQGFPEANNWSSLNALSFATGASFGTSQLSPGLSGDYFCRLSVMPNSQGTSNPAAVIAGDYNFITGTGSNGFPVSEVPPTLFGYYRSNVNAPDFAAAGVYFTKYNAALNQTDTVASGTFVFNQYVTNWTPFYIDIETFTSETPDTCQIFFVIGGGYAPIAGNYLDIDNLTFNLPCAGAGCTDGTACNFDPDAVFNNGSCLYVGTPCNDNDPITSNDVIQTDCSCLGEIILPGCNQPSACNYDPAATIDDGSCLFEGQSCDDGDPLTFLDVIGADCSCQGQLESILGCTISGACNYNAAATIDDGSCNFPGDSCDDGDPNTFNDILDINCNCAGVVSVDEIESAILIYPNPATDEVSVTLNGSAAAQVTVLDITGRVVMTAQRTARINIQPLADGIYTFRIQHEGKQWEKQVVKK
ncbi:MAG: T9SS type A sorting domain-containing protein, partial [Flavobacteriales bacterium]